jgi:uncharacterized protein YqjF (DUF2071 family)
LALDKDKIPSVLESTEHRPWELLSRPWGFYQEWKDVIFLHWKVDAKELERYVPKGLEIDLFEGSAWVSLVCFSMRNVRPRYLPAVPLVSNFEEINLRTYVKNNGKRAVYFISIEVNKYLASCLARWISGTPYHYAPIAVSKESFSVFNRNRIPVFEVEYRVGDKLNSSSRDTWLTERYALFQDINGCLKSFDIHHKPWPLQELEVESLDVDQTMSRSLFSGSPDIAHYSPGVVTLAWKAENL